MYKSWMWKQRSYREQFQGDEATGGAGGTVVDDQSQDGEQAEAQAEPDQQDPDAAAQQDEEVVVSFGDEPVPESEEVALELSPVQNSAWARMRKAERELKARVRELEQAAAGQQPPAAANEDPVGTKPTLEECEFDAEAYAEKVLAWSDRKKAAEAKVRAAAQEQEAQQAAWTGKLNAYKAAGASLKISGFEDAEAVVTSVLSPVQQQILVQGPKTAQASAQLVAALGRNPAKLKELAGIKDNVQYTFAVAELVGQLKVTSRSQPPAPEKQVRGTASGVTGVDNTLQRLQAEADKSGDRSKVAAYLRKQKQAA